MAIFGRPILRIIIFFLLLGYFAVRLFLYHFYLVTYPYPQGLREGAMMVSTQALLKGLNPYAISLQPQLMNQYGIVFPLAVWPWAKVFGPTMLVHRAVLAFFILACCALVFLVLQKMKIPYVLNFWAVLMLYGSLLYPGTSTPVDPGAMGTFFFLLTVFIPWLGKYSYPSLVLSILCALLAFYTKAYVFLGAMIMVSYIFLFVSKFKGVFYGLVLGSLSLISVIAVNHLFPAYFDNCFFASLNMSHAWASTERLHEQIVKYAKLHQWTLVLLCAFMAVHVLKAILSKDSVSNIKSSMDGIFANLNLVKFKGPLIKVHFPLPLYAAACSSFVLYVSLGRHSGAMLWYFFQLLSPFLLICAVWVFSRQAYWSFVCLPFLILNLLTMTSDQNYRVFDKKMAGWSDIAAVISQHENILNTPLIAPLLVEQNKEVVDDGQAEYFGAGAGRPAWMNRLAQRDPRVDFQLFVFFYNIREKVEEKKYDLIILQPGLLPLGVGDDIKKYYKYEGGTMLYAPQDRRSYGVTLWKPL
jgi:hypothetical protein